MKILFLCGSIEPGKDGVGDYTRRLSGELLRNGHKVKIISLMDNNVNTYKEEIQITDNNLAINTKRIPKESSIAERKAYVKQILNEEGVDWISLQYVPHSFNDKGLPFWLPNFLKQFKGK